MIYCFSWESDKKSILNTRGPENNTFFEIIEFCSQKNFKIRPKKGDEILFFQKKGLKQGFCSDEGERQSDYWTVAAFWNEMNRYANWIDDLEAQLKSQNNTVDGLKQENERLRLRLKQINDFHKQINDNSQV